MKTFVAECHTEPRGNHGLEGYQRGEKYMAIHQDSGLIRVYPVAGQDYWEAVTPTCFNKYFEVSS
jgi:hypothetical protein